MAEWYLYALATMVLFSFANITLKSLLSEDLIGVLQKNMDQIIPAAITVFAGIIIAYFLFISKLPLPQNTPMLLIVFLLLASAGFVMLMLAVASGKIAPVTAIVSTSSITVAILSIVLLQNSLSLREVAGIGLAFIGVLLLAFK
ncbi:MAG: EamA family transporter [Candidatus Micrarchaeota archaeon]